MVRSHWFPLLVVDVSSSIVSDMGLAHIHECKNLQALCLNYYDNISEMALNCLISLKSLTSLSLKKSNVISEVKMRHLVELVHLTNLDLESLPRIHEGFYHIRRMKKRECLNIGWCNCITNNDIKSLARLANLVELHISQS